MPQQSTLSFGKPKSTGPVDETELEANGVAEGEGEAKPNQDKDEDGDMMNGGPEMVEANDKAAEAVSANHEDDMSIDQNTAGFPPQKGSHKSPKRSQAEMKAEEDEDEDEPILKRSRKGKALKPIVTEGKAEQTMKSTKPAKKSEPPKVSRGRAQRRDAPEAIDEEGNKFSKPTLEQTKAAEAKATETELAKRAEDNKEDANDQAASEQEDDAESEEDEKPEIAAKAREKVQSSLKSSGKDPYPDWKPREPVPYAALCTTFSLIEMTTKRLVISAHCSLFLRQVLRLTPQELLPTVQLMINKLAADYAGIELGIGESLIMKAIGETTGRSLQVIKADQNEIGDLGLVAAKSRGNQPTMFKPKPLTVRGVLDGLMAIATTSGGGSQGLKVAGIKKLLSAADASKAGKGIDITKDKGGPSEAKFIIRFLEGKLRLGLAEKTVLVAIAHAMVMHETAQKGDKVPSSEKLAQGEAILKTVYRYVMSTASASTCLTIVQ